MNILLGWRRAYRTAARGVLDRNIGWRDIFRILCSRNIRYEKQMTDLDPFEIKILRELQRDANQTTAEIAERVGLSVSPCWRRIDRLEREGFIKKRVAIVDRRKVGLNAHVFAQVKLNAHGRANLDEFSAAIQGFPEVLDAYVLMGTTDFMLRIVARDIDAYERFFFDQLSKLPGVQEINSTVALSEIKATTELPLGVE
jgi:Lrp/AsnC family transcriptional regulator